MRAWGFESPLRHQQLTTSKLPLDLQSLRHEGLSPPLVVGVVGINLWFGLLALPMWHLHSLGSMTAAATLTIFAALCPLMAGIVLLVRGRRGADESLLIGFPALVFLAIFLQPALTGPSVFSAGTTAIVGVSFLAYVVGSCWACHRSRIRMVKHEATPLEDHSGPRSRRWPWTLVIFAALLGLLVIGVGHLSQSSADDGADTGLKGRTIVMSVGALLLWCLAYFGILAPTLRRRKQRRLGVASRGAALVWLLVVLLAGAMLVLSSVE